MQRRPQIGQAFQAKAQAVEVLIVGTDQSAPADPQRHPEKTGNDRRQPPWPAPNAASAPQGETHPTGQSDGMDSTVEEQGQDHRHHRDDDRERDL